MKAFNLQVKAYISGILTASANLHPSICQSLKNISVIARCGEHRKQHRSSALPSQAYQRQRLEQRQLRVRRLLL